MKPSLFLGLAALAGVVMLTPLYAQAQSSQSQPNANAPRSSQGHMSQSPNASSMSPTMNRGAMSGSMESGQSRMNLSTQQIKQAQSALKEQGLYGGAIDGIVGPRTRRGLTDYQAQEGLPRTGRLDRQTLSGLMGNSSSGMTGAQSGSATGTSRGANQ